jgi:hypothetical protein
LILAALYNLAKLHSGGAQLPPTAFNFIFPKASNWSYNYAATTYFPWTDVSENVYHAFVLAHGGLMYRDAIVPHMPGVPQFVASLMAIFGFADAIPGPSTAIAAWLTGSLAAVLFQVGSCFIALRMLQFSRVAAILLALVPSAYTARYFDFAEPMSETLIAYAFVLLPVLAYKMLLSSERSDRVAAAVILAGPVTLVCLDVGLTAAPANAAVAIACLAVVGWELHQARTATWLVLLADWRCQVSYAAMAAMAIVTYATVKLSEMYFWIVDHNLAGVPIHPVAVFIDSFGLHFRDMLGVVDPLGSRYPHLLAASAIFVLCMALTKPTQKRIAVQAVLFLALMLLAAILTQWRTALGYKSVTIFGLTLGVLFISLHLAMRNWRPAPDFLLVGLFASALTQVNLLSVAAGSYATTRAPRNSALDEAGVCRFGQSSGCRCLQVTIFGPQTFLWTDVGACAYRYPTAAGPISWLPVLRQRMIDDAKRPDMAFWVYSSEKAMLDNGVPAEAIHTWRTQHRCIPLAEAEAICFRPSP